MARDNTLDDWDLTKIGDDLKAQEYDLDGMTFGTDFGKGSDLSAFNPTSMLKMVQLAMPTLMRSGMSGQDVLIKKVIDNPNIELTEEGLRKAGFSDNDIDLFMKDDRFLEAVAARESEKYKEKWNKDHEDKSLFKEFAMEALKDSIYYI